MRVHHSIIYVLLPFAAFLLLSMNPMSEGKEKPTKGFYVENSGIFDQAKGKTCRIDSANGTVIQIDKDHENPLFPSKLTNQVHLMLWFKNGIENKRYQLPNPEVEVCYWEKGDLLMFHSFVAKGWVEFDAYEAGSKLQGKMELKLVEPHHNMSNSDYHYMGGDILLKAQPLK